MPNLSTDILKSKEYDTAATELARVGRFLAERGWAPATSSNYSVRLNLECIALTRSGVDKYQMRPGDVIVVDYNGKMIVNADATASGASAEAANLVSPAIRPSAETLIHTVIYKARPEAGAVLHSHSVPNTRLSLKHLAAGYLHIQGYEMQKGLAGVTTHEALVRVPILPNAQDMQSFSLEVEKLLAKEKAIHGFLIAGHGLYTWGQNLAEAQRHIETFEFLFDCLRHEELGF